MERHQPSYGTSGSADANGALDVKPMRTLSPMFPTTYGLNTFSQSNSVPFVYSLPSDSAIPSFITQNFPAFSGASQQAPLNPQPISQTPTRATPTHNGPRPRSQSNGSALPASFRTPKPIALDDDDEDNDDDNDEDFLPSGQTSASGRRIKQPTHLSGYRVGSSSVTDGSSSGKSRLPLKKKAKKFFHADSALIPSLLDPRDSVEVVLMTFDALRRRLSQLDDGHDAKSNRPDLKAGTTLMSSDLRANMGKRIGTVPGIEIGDIYYFRMELCVVGLHAPIMGGIDYMTASFGDGDDTVAVSIVSAGGYENEETDVDTLIYTGQGGNTNSDQKLERGNLALERSLHRGNVIRVTRSAKDNTLPNGKIYFYDGLYKLDSSWVDKGKSGFNIFKYKLLRQPGQAPGLAIWKMTQQWKDNPSSRGRVILPDISSGVENIPVCLVNEVDDERGPSHFKYVTKVEYLRPLTSMKPLETCRCFSVCLPGDNNCSCAKFNGGSLPYSSTGTLVSRKHLIYECNSSCCCSPNCRNRVTQRGIRFQFEAFKTRDRGWGLRSWDPIRAGTFIFEYTGEVINKINLNDENAEEDDYIFQTTGVDEKTLKWNYGPELLGEPSADQSNEAIGPFPIIISAKKMGNLSRFVNHSCSPNVFWQPVLHDHGDEGYPHIMFFAMKHIPPLTELTYDYGLSGDVGSRRTKKCLCGSSKCRGLFG